MISVVIPAFNRPQKVRRAVASVVSQKDLRPDGLEIIVVDDTSIPPLQLHDADPRVRIVRLVENKGPAGARNAGIQASCGEYLAFLDSDDLWLPDKLARQLAMFKELQRSMDKSLITLVCGFYYPNRVTGRLEARIPRSASHLSDFASGCWFSPGSALFLHRSAYDRVGLLDERLRRLEDLDWFIRFGQEGGQLHVLSCVGTVIAPSRSEDFDTVMHSSAIIEQKFSPSGAMPLPRSEWQRLRAYLALEQGAALLLEGQRLRGLAYLLASFWHKPRLQAALEPFWQKSDEVPATVAEMYKQMSLG